MRVLIVHSGGVPHTPSGELMVARDELRGLQAAGVEARLEVVHNPFDLASLRNRLGALRGLFWSRASRRWLAGVLDDFAPQLVHFHGVLPVLSPAVFELCQRRDLPVVQTLHNFRWLCVEGGLFRDDGFCTACLQGRPWAGVRHGCTRGSSLASLGMYALNQVYRRSRLLYGWVDLFIAVSEFVRGWHLRLGFPAAQVVVKHNGLDLATFPRPAGDEARWGVAYVGRINQAKGAGALERLIRELPHPITVVGQGEQEPRLRALAAELGRGDVAFLGRQPRQAVLKTLGAARCVVVPSVCGETWSLVAAEALAMATPVVAYAVGGLPELLGGGRGVLAPAFDEAAFAREVGRLCRDKARARAMGRMGREFVRNRLDLKITTAQLMELYQELLEAEARGDAGRGAF